MPNIGDIINGYEIIRELNVGNYCTSYEVMKGGAVYFFKEYSEPTRLSSDYNSFLENQYKIIPKLNGLGSEIEKVIEQFEYKYRYCQVKEFIAGSSLRIWCSKYTNFTVRKSLAVSMCKIVDSIHRAGIIHQDLKPDQFMVVSDTKSDCGFGLILTDFDWSVLDGNVVRFVGTHFYSNIDSKITQKTDIFTLGVIICELLIGKNPYRIDSSLLLDQEELERYWKQLVFDKQFDIPIKLCPHNITPEISSVITRCLDPEPEKRPEIEDILYCLEFDKLRSVPLIKSFFVPIPNIDTTVNIAAMRNSSNLTERIKKYKIEIQEPPALLKVIAQQKIEVTTMPHFKPLHICIKEEIFTQAIRKKFDSFSNIVSDLIKGINKKNIYNDDELHRK